jgi:branched-chain amino acid transport system substrate-binding protein
MSDKDTTVTGPNSAEDDGRWIEDLGRRAGAALRKPAPDTGLVSLKQRQRRRTTQLGTAAGMAGVLMVAAVIFATRRNDGPATIQGPATTVVATTNPVAPRVAADVSWATQYLGVQPGAATGTPYKIGWIGGDAATLADLRAVAAYLNANATGVGGRPIEFVSCDSSSGREQTCADEFATRNDFALVMSDMGAVSSKPFKTLVPNKAIELIVSSGSAAIGTDAYILNTDGPSWYRLVLSFAINFLPASVKNIVIVNDLGIGSFGSDQGEFITTRPGATVSFVKVSGDASSDDIASKIREKPGAADADVFLAFGNKPNFCTNLPAARSQLGSTATVMLFDLCVMSVSGKAMLDSEPGRGSAEGTYVLSQFDLLDSGGDGFDVYKKATGKDGTVYTPGQDAFRGLMTMVRILNEAGNLDTLTSTDIHAAMANYHGSVPMNAGPMNCGNLNPGYGWVSAKSACGEHANLYRFEGGKLVAIADGRNGKLLGFQGIVDADPNLFPKPA